MQTAQGLEEVPHAVERHEARAHGDGGVHVAHLHPGDRLHGGVRAHHPDPAVPTDDGVGGEFDRADDDAKNPSRETVAQAVREEVHDEVVARAHEFLGTQEDHPDERELNPVVRLREVVDRHEPHEDVQDEHDEDRRHGDDADRAHDAAEKFVAGAKERKQRGHVRYSVRTRGARRRARGRE